MFFAACSVGWIVGRIESSMCSITADVSGAPAMRNARAKARRRITSLTHCGTGCSHAPRPGRVPAGSTVTAYLPFPADTATTRSSSTANSRFRHPTHVRTGPSVRRCAEAEVSRWIAAYFTRTQPVVRTTRTATVCVVDPSVIVRQPAGRIVLGMVSLLVGRVPADVDPPAGEPGGQPRILAFLSDGQRQLEVGHHHAGGPGVLVDHGHRDDLGRRQRIGDEARRVVVEVDDVDLLPGQLAHHVAHPLAHRSDAGALGIESGNP